MPAFLNHMRLFNLLMIALTMVLIRFTLIEPFLKFENSDSSVSRLWFFILVVSVVLIAAGGYFINDSDDERIDRINKPDRNNRMQAGDLRFYGTLMLATGVLLGAAISYFGQMKAVWSINLISALLLLNYSRFLKRIPLVGALVVSLLTALVLVVVFISDKAAIHNINIRNLIAGYCLFAFLLSFIREVIKDMEDAEGDRAGGRKTFTVMAGFRASRLLIAILLLITLGLIVYIQFFQKQWESIPAFFYTLLLIEIPMIYLLVKIFTDQSARQFHRSHLICRLIMLAGVLTMPFFYFIW